MRKGKRIRAAAICLTAHFAVYTVFVYFLVSACLVPSFMDRLNAFEDITRKCYAEQVQTSDIQENQSRLLSDTAKWLETVDRKKIAARTADGYTLVRRNFPLSRRVTNGCFFCTGIPDGRKKCISLHTGILNRDFMCLCRICAVRGRARGISLVWAGRIIMTVSSGLTIS